MSVRRAMGRSRQSATKRQGRDQRRGCRVIALALYQSFLNGLDKSWLIGGARRGELDGSDSPLRTRSTGRRGRTARRRARPAAGSRWGKTVFGAIRRCSRENSKDSMNPSYSEFDSESLSWLEYAASSARKNGPRSSTRPAAINLIPARRDLDTPVQQGGRRR